MHTGLKRQIIRLAEDSPSQEVCGFIYAGLDTTAVFPCRNVALDPANRFEISSDDHLACLQLGDIIGVYHSHVTGPAEFSEGQVWTDKEVSEEAALPFYLYHLPSQSWKQHLPASYTVPLEGRRFLWGFEDCYETARHYFRQTLSIHLRDYDRDETFGPTKSDAIRENLHHEGFVQLNPSTTKIKLHDALLFDVSPRCPQHLGIFVSPQRMLHHPRKSLSHIDLIDGRWTSKLVSVLRHQTLC